MPELNELVSNAMELPLHERAYLARILIESIDEMECAEINEENVAEILKRCRDIDEGKVNLISAKEAIARIQESII